MHLLRNLIQTRQNKGDETRKEQLYLSRLPPKQPGSKKSEDDIYEQLSGTWVVIWKGHFASSEGLS